MAPIPNEVSVDAIRDSLERIISSRYFARSVRLSRFLRFAVEHALAGTSEQVKEYLVGVEVFDRRPDYDPRVDPIVRVEARRLRSKLEAYYGAEGQSDAVRIEFPTGAYTPVFRPNQPVATSPVVAASAETGIAVLPFANLGESEDYFSDGLTEELIHLLTRVGGLRVVAWHSASQMRGREEDIGAIRERLGVDRALRGSVRRTASRVRVAAQLVDAHSGAYLWSEVYERQIEDVLSIQEEIAKAIVRNLRLTLAPARAAGRTTGNVESFALCLQGRFQANKRTADGIRRSVRCFEEAIALDPESALAHAGLADAYSLLADYGVIHPSDVVPQAERAARKALELDPGSAEAHASLGLIQSLYYWNWDEAEAVFRRGVELNPGYAMGRHWFGIDCLAMRGKFEEAAEHVETSRHLDPLSLITHESAAYLHILRREPEIALARYRALVEMDTTFYRSHSSLGRALLQMGRYAEALQELERARSLAPDTPNILGAYAQALGLNGRPADARRAIGELRRMAAARYVPSTCFAVAHLGLSEYEESLSWLEKGVENHEFSVAPLKVHPLYDPLRGHPRFERLVLRLGA